MNAHVAVNRPEGVQVMGPVTRQVIVRTQGLFTHYQEVVVSGVDLEAVAVSGIDLAPVVVAGVDLEAVGA